MDRKDAIRQKVATYNALKNERARRESHWQLLAEYMLPHKAAITVEFLPGARPFAEKFDGSGMLAAATCAANLYNTLTPPAKHWMILSPPAGRRDLSEDRRYEQSLGDLTEAVHVANNQSNFATEIHSAFEDLLLGTCCVGVKKGTKKPFILSTRPQTEYCFLTDEEGRPDTVFVERQWTAYEAARRFGKDRLPETLRLELENASPTAYTSKKPFLNILEPNDGLSADLGVPARHRYSNLWVDLGREEKPVLETGGSRRLPYVISRFWRATGLSWGMGPCDMAYSWVRCLDKVSEIVLKYAAKAMDPPSIWPDDGAFTPMSVDPGTMISGRLGPTDRGKPQFLELQGDHRLTEFLFQYYSGLILRAFFQDIFQVMDRKQRTAQEVMTILEKSYDLAIPVVGRMKSELFDPLILLELERLTEFNLGIEGWRYGGKELPEYAYDLELISPLALAVKYAELQNMSDLLVMNGRVAAIDPKVWHNYNLDEMSRAIGDNMAVPRKWLRSVSERNAIREALADRMAQQAALQDAQAAAETTNKMSKAVEPGSPMAALTAA